MIALLNRGGVVKGFVQGADRQQTTLLPECLDDWVDESNPVRAVDVFVDALELRDLGFDGVDPAATGRPGYHPSPMLKLYIYGYLNRVQSSRRLEREAGRNLEVMWLTGRLVPDHKTIADFRKDNGPAIKKVCVQFVALCRKMGLLAKASVAIDGSKFKAVNSRDNNFTKGKMERRLAQIEESVARYLSQLDTADRQTAAGEAVKTGKAQCEHMFSALPLRADIAEQSRHVRFVANCGNSQSWTPAYGSRNRPGNRSSVCLARAAIEPGEAHPRPAAAGIVHDHQPRADALHPHLAAFSVVAAVVGEGDRIVLRRDLRLEVAVMKIARGRKRHSAFNLQPAAIAGPDFDAAAGMVPAADPIRRLRRRHRGDRRQRRAGQPAVRPNLLFRQR